jgi:hypothetical protein
VGGEDFVVAQAILMTMLFTAAKLKQDGLRFLSEVLVLPPAHRPPVGGIGVGR